MRRDVNAAVVGLLLAELHHRVWTSAIQGNPDFALGPTAFAPLVFWTVPPWLVMTLSGVATGSWNASSRESSVQSNPRSTP